MLSGRSPSHRSLESDRRLSFKVARNPANGIGGRLFVTDVFQEKSDRISSPCYLSASVTVPCILAAPHSRLTQGIVSRSLFMM